MQLPDASQPIHGFDASPRAVDAWIGALPRANLGGATREIFQALRVTNSARLKPAHRLHILERAAEVVDESMPQLERHYAEANWPLDERAMRVAQMVLTLRQELSAGYRLVLKAPRSWSLFRRGSADHACACARLIRIVSDLIAQCRLLHQPEPPGAWSVMHRAFSSASLYDEMETPVAALGKGAARTTISREYRRALLRSLLSPADFTRDHWRRAHERLDEWAALTTLRAPTSACTGIHCIHTDADIGPATTRSRCAESCGPDAGRLHLDTTALIEALSTPHPPVPQALAEALIRAWREPGERRETRSSAEETLEAAFGFTAIHSLILANGGASTAAARKSGEWSIDGVEGYRVDDEWGALYVDIREYQRNNWAQAFGQQQNYDTHTVVVENESENGRCLHLPAQTRQPVRVGDVAGLRDATGRWEIGAVRRVQAEDIGRGLFGLRRLLCDADAVVLRVATDGQYSDPLPGFAGTGPGGAHALLVPYLPGRRKRFVLDRGEGDHSLITDEILGAGTHYVLYKFHVESRPGAHSAPPPAKSGGNAALKGREPDAEVWGYL